MSENSYAQFFKKAQAAQNRPNPKKSSSPATRPGAGPKPKPKGRFSRPPPAKAVVGLAVTFVLVLFYLISPASFERLFDRIEIRALGEAMASSQETPAKPAAHAAEKSPASPEAAEKTAGGAGAGSKPKPVEEKSAVGEDLSHFENLKRRKDELDARERELGELEEELQRQKVELDKRITQLEDMRGQIAQTLKDRVEVDQEKVNKLVELYSNMKPKQAADVIGSINEDLAVEVLAKMKKKNAAEVMNLLPPEKARILSEKYTGYRRGNQEPKG